MIEARGRFICLSGVDGTGKTTHAEAIVGKIRALGGSCKYVWLRRPYLFSLPLLGYCRLIGLTRCHYSDGNRYGRWEFYRSRFVTTLFPWVLLVDTALFAFFRVRLHLWQGKTVVCDRFVYDTMVDTMVAVKDFELYKKCVGKLFLRLVPNKKTVIFLDCNENTIKERKPETIYDSDLSIRRALYLALANHLQAPIINTSHLVTSLNDIILRQT